MPSCYFGSSVMPATAWVSRSINRWTTSRISTHFSPGGSGCRDALGYARYQVNILKFLREQAKNYDCSACGTNHSRSEINVLGKREGGWVVRVTCGKCETAITLLVYVGENSAA